MLATVEFDNEPQFVAVKVDDVMTERYLPAELEIAELPVAKAGPEQRFGIGDGRKRSYREVGENLGVTAEAARRLVKRAVNTVRDRATEVIDAA